LERERRAHERPTALAAVDLQVAVERLDSVEQAAEAGSPVEPGSAFPVVLDLDQRRRA
jgi:hypothetical protein